jgi:uncharacterized RDD family membrane protein YckC
VIGEVRLPVVHEPGFDPMRYLVADLVAQVWVVQAALVA